MSSKPQTVATRARGRYTAMVRHHGPDAQQTIEAREALAVARIEARIAAAVEAAPALPDGQWQEIWRAAFLRRQAESASTESTH
jgi:hypothetical protein